MSVVDDPALHEIEVGRSDSAGWSFTCVVCAVHETRLPSEEAAIAAAERHEEGPVR